MATIIGAIASSHTPTIGFALDTGKQEDPAWSAWQPKGSSTAKVRQIADRIPKEYRTQNGAQLTVSLAGSSTQHERGRSLVFAPTPVWRTDSNVLSTGTNSTAG